MKILAVSGSARQASTNTALLRGLRAAAPEGIEVEVFHEVGGLPVFSPDLEAEPPDAVRRFKLSVADCDGMIISSPEYIRGIPGGLKNAIDWLVSGDEIIGKPVVLAHASHRGDDMLASLRTVLATVSSRFNQTLFYRLPVMKESPEAIIRLLESPVAREDARAFLAAFADYCRESCPPEPGYPISPPPRGV